MVRRNPTRYQSVWSIQFPLVALDEAARPRFSCMISDYSHIEGPLAGAHHRLGGARFGQPVGIRRSRTDHKIAMHQAVVAASLAKLLVGHSRAAFQRELVGASPRQLAGLIF